MNIIDKTDIWFNRMKGTQESILFLSFRRVVNVIYSKKE